MTLFDAMGRVVLEKVVQLPTSESLFLPDLTSGIYWLRLRNDDWQQQEKIVIQKP